MTNSKDQAKRKHKEISANPTMTTSRTLSALMQRLNDLPRGLADIESLEARDCWLLALVDNIRDALQIAYDVERHASVGRSASRNDRLAADVLLAERLLRLVEFTMSPAFRNGIAKQHKGGA